MHEREQMDADPVGSADTEIFDCFSELVSDLIAHAERVARHFGVPMPFLKALHLLEGPMAMKDLGQGMRCDPSFVTAIADMLESRGLATRQADPADRRVKRIALTTAGLELKRQLESEILSRMPWQHSLSPAERTCFLGHLRAMLHHPQPRAASGGTAEACEEVITAPAPFAGAQT